MLQVVARETGSNSLTHGQFRDTFLGGGGGEKPGGGGQFLIRGYWGCAAGWGRIFTTGLTIMWSHFQ